MDLAPRFIDEKIGDQWAVDETKESFSRLMRHIHLKTRFKTHFERALSDWRLCSRTEGMIVADIGAGVGWTSALMALRPEVEKVYVVEPSENRLKCAKAIATHFCAPLEKLVFINGTFDEPKVPEKVHLVSLCASFHHCWDRDLPKLFENIRNMLIPDEGLILLSNEHYVNRLYILRRLISWVINFPKQPFSWRTEPDKWSSEHVRFKHEINKIFKREGFNVKYFPLEGNLCAQKAKWRLHEWLTWTYYYAILSLDQTDVKEQ
jgi:SAM-dependent methyltransferase